MQGNDAEHQTPNNKAVHRSERAGFQMDSNLRQPDDLGSFGGDYKQGDIPMSKVTPFLMFNDQLEAAIAFYTATFPDSRIKNVARTG